MSASDVLLLVCAGIGAGLTGPIAGLAPLISYPALLATGLPPLGADVTNTTALMGNAVGTTIGSRRELVRNDQAILRPWRPDVLEQG